MYTMYKTKIKKALSLHRVTALVALLLLMVLSMANPLSAQTAFTQGYGADEALQRGMIVRLKEDDSTKVTALPYDQMDAMLGVVVNSNDAPVTLSAEGQKVFVATGGKYDVLVSDQNGEIEPGAYLTVSSYTGIGMVAGTKESLVVGRALDGFNGSDNVIGTSEVTLSDGTKKKVNFTRISADISVSRNPKYGTERQPIPETLRKAAEEIAGKKVDTARVYLALAIFLICTIVAGTLMYGGVRSGIISIGRNPLSKKSIIKGMLQVVLFGLIIFILGLFGVYLLLKL